MTNKTEKMRPQFDPKNFEHKWEAKITQVTMTNTADIVELTQQVTDLIEIVKKLQSQILQMESMYVKKIN